MPITLTVPEGLLSSEAEAQVFTELTDALLKVSQLLGNAFMTPNVVGTINVLPQGRVFSGGKPAAAAFIELKLPEIALATDEAKQAFIDAATTIVERASNGRVSRDHIWTNIVYAAEGSWGIGGQVYGNSQLVSAIQQAASL
ncbi:Tautomerase enzyme [Rhizobium calliandrae]|uniref:Tautomerase enzyme n=1 Tax=Rhizobium calliandrae TaxID=1312182 RepID=A0ABT7KHR7_9HYPH|nr:Tautomerase enzyme [Rhizobium calliandrae]MDL2407540.1 Tautomerase enzyme [Rhizobium calliandrae]